jgi:hypothetical protein
VGADELLPAIAGTASSNIHSTPAYVDRQNGRRAFGGTAVYVHYFHCTDGISFFADEQGSRIARDEEFFLAAMKRAETVMRELPSHDWSDWIVCVYDDLRQMVEVFNFPAMRALAQLGRAGAVGDVICAARRGALPRSGPLKRHL